MELTMILREADCEYDRQKKLALVLSVGGFAIIGGGPLGCIARVLVNRKKL
jgi:hypothetical protein